MIIDITDKKPQQSGKYSRHLKSLVDQKTLNLGIHCDLVTSLTHFIPRGVNFACFLFFFFSIHI